MADDYATLLHDLAGEQASLLGAIASIDDDAWFTPTPAKGWDVRDVVSHLADTDEIAIDTCTGGARPLNDFALGLASPEDATLWGVLRGRRMPGAEVRSWYERTSRAEIDVLATLDQAMRVPWGLGMRPPSFVTARMMECWAHSLDVRDALALPAADTDRLRHVAWIATRALPYAYTVAGREPPEGALRVELTLPSGAMWAHGPSDAPNRITGSASEYCRVFVQRMPRAAATGLRAEGDAADAALDVARAYL
jgi:uncharacterized protein (TIGR03084 family)